MTNAEPEESGQRFTEKTTSDSHFSWIRTRLSLERTFMSWIRTSIALIGFGFTIVQFFEKFGAMQGIAPALRPEMPRYFGLALIGTGILALAISFWQYRWSINYLTGPQYAPIAASREDKMHTPILGVAVLLMLIGLLAFGAILFRLI